MAENARTSYAVEYSCKVNTAVTDIDIEMTACFGSVVDDTGGGGGSGLVFSAWDDGQNWDDGAVGWDDWPPPGAEL